MINGLRFPAREVQGAHHTCPVIFTDHRLSTISVDMYVQKFVDSTPFHRREVRIQQLLKP
jgi:hypothetical protein